MFKICSKFVHSMSKKEAPAKKTGCTLCGALTTAGRSGEKVLKFVNGDMAKIEIINESNVERRMCYTLNILNDLEVGWNDIPIKYCPFCGKKLGGEC